MRLTHMLLLSLFSQKPTIHNIDLPICKNCRHFIPYEEDKNSYNFGRCGVYGRKDVVSGIITYEYADHARRNSEQCGKLAENYEKIKPDVVKPK